MGEIFQNIGKEMLEKGKIFKNLGKNKQNLKIFCKRAGETEMKMKHEYILLKNVGMKHILVIKFVQFMYYKGKRFIKNI